MGQTLTNGIYLPDEGERNSYPGLEANWRTLDALILTINGKAAPNVANTWTAAQTFTAGIAGDLTGNVTGNVTGDLTGTASRATADEDGTSIKSGYVNVAGNQTVTGQKTWSGNAFYTAGVYHRNNSYGIGNTPASNVAIPLYFTDKVNVHTGYVRNVILTTGKTQSELLARNKFTNGALSPTGTDVSSTLQVEVQSNGDKTLYFDGSIRNNVLPYATNSYSLGSSSYQWSSVYAQSYYYNGAEFLNKFVTTDTSQTINADKEFYYNKYLRVGGYRFSIKNSSYEKGVIPSSNQWTAFNFVDKYNNPFFTVEYGNIANGRVIFKFTSSTNETNPTNIEFFTYQHKEGESNFISVSTDFVPKTTSTQDLGTSTNKWKTLNGVNPGALSLPSSSYVEIDTTNWDLTGASSQSYTPAVHGWLYISIQNIAGNYLSMAGGRGAISMDGTGVQSGLRAMLPVIANEAVTITVKTGSIFAARFYPMLGNV